MKGTLVFVKAGQKIPDAFTQKVLAAHSAGAAYAYADKDGLDIGCGQGKFEVKEINEYRDAAKDRDIVFMFADAEVTNTDDEQPFVMIGDADKPELVGFAVGEFTNFTPKDGDHTNEYYLYNKYLGPKAKKFGADTDAIMNNMGDEVSLMEIKAMLKEQAHLVIMDKKGRWLEIQDNVDRKEYDWGWVSETHGYEEQKAKGGLFRKPIASTESIKQPVVDKQTVVHEEAKDKPVQATHAGGNGTQTAHIDLEGVHWDWAVCPPPSKGCSNRVTKEYYNQAVGHLPQDWRGLKDRQESYKYKKYRDPNKLVEQVPKEVVTVKDFKDLKNNVTAVKVDVDKQVTTEVLPVMSPMILQAVGKDFLDKSSTAIPYNPDELADLEKAFDSFWKATNIEQKVTDAWRFSTFNDLAHKYPVACAVLCFNYMVRAQLAESLVNLSEHDKVDTTGKPPITTVEQVVERAEERKADDEAAAERRRRKKAAM